VKLANEVHTLNGCFSLEGLAAAREFLEAALKSVSILHSMGTAHRNLKPANRIDKHGALVLSDPGMDVFPTSLDRPVSSSGASPPTPR
jgi:hypothetical protein